MSITVHVTHEAIHKVGGIGAVIAGVVTSGPYLQSTERTILVGPLTGRHQAEPLGVDGTVLYDNWSGVWSEPFGTALYDVEHQCGVRLVYGRRRFLCPDGTQVEPEVLLVDVEGSVPHGLGHFKYRIPSLGPPAVSALYEVLDQVSERDERRRPILQRARRLLGSIMLEKQLRARARQGARPLTHKTRAATDSTASNPDQANPDQAKAEKGNGALEQRSPVADGFVGLQRELLTGTAWFDRGETTETGDEA